MKKIIIMLLLAPLFVSGQPYITSTVDFRNAVIGSKPTNDKPELDIILKAGVIAYNGVPIKVGIIYERFNALKFNKYCAEIGYDFKKFLIFDIQASIEGGWISRYNMNFWTYGLNLDTIYFINDNLGVVLYYNLSKATDTDALWNEKGNFRNNFSIGLTWRFNEYKAKY